MEKNTHGDATWSFIQRLTLLNQRACSSASFVRDVTKHKKVSNSTRKLTSKNNSNVDFVIIEVRENIHGYHTRDATPTKNHLSAKSVTNGSKLKENWTFTWNITMAIDRTHVLFVTKHLTNQLILWHTKEHFTWRIRREEVMIVMFATRHWKPSSPWTPIWSYIQIKSHFNVSCAPKLSNLSSMSNSIPRPNIQSLLVSFSAIYARRFCHKLGLLQSIWRRFMKNLKFTDVLYVTTLLLESLPYKFTLMLHITISSLSVHGAQRKSHTNQL